jgi:NAD(P)-dependent dehydrogenase (short-subunit alcohol dehydrogenase family)
MAPVERVAVVTGASRGIGRAIALALVREGAHVIGVARSANALVPIVQEVAALGGGFDPLALDLSDPDAAQELTRALDPWGRLDMLVGNAAILGPLAPVVEVKREAFERVLATNLTANWALLAALDPLLCRAEAGRALFMTAGAPREPFANVSAYATSKSGLEALVKTYALERRSTNVRANLFNPGPVRTDMRAEAVANDQPERLPTPEQVIPHIVPMLSRAFERSGVIYDFPTRSVIA